MINNDNRNEGRNKMKKLYNLLFVLTIMLTCFIGMNGVKAENEIAVDANIINGNKATLNFTVDDESLNIKEFRVFRSALPGEEAAKPIYVGSTTDSYYDLTDLVKNTNYTFNILGIIKDEGDEFITVDGNVDVKTPNYEIKAKGEALNGNMVKLSWTKEEGVKEYKIFRSAAPDEEAAKPIYVDTTTDSSYVVKELKNNTEYRFHVVAVVNDDESYEDVADVETLNYVEHYGLYVNGEEFTSEKDEIKCGKGTATFDESTKTLVLNNAVIDNNDDHLGIYHDGDFESWADSELKIVLKGENVIENDNAGISAVDIGRLIITGSGTLDINILQCSEEEFACTGIVSTSYVDIIDTNVSVSGYISFGIFGDNITIDNSNINVSVEDENENTASAIYGTNISVDGDSNVVIEAYNGLVADEGFIKIKGGNFIISAVYPVQGELDIDSYNGKMMAGYEYDGTNADLFAKDKLKDELEDYIMYIKLGDFDVYKVINDSNEPDFVYIPGNAFAGENIRVDSKFGYVYEIDSVKILKASDQSDITDKINFNSETNEFTMPDYPIIIKTNLTKVYADVPENVSAKLKTYNSVNFVWSDDLLADGFYIYYKKSSDKNYTYLGRTSNYNYVVNNLQAGTRYDFKVVPHIDFDGKRYKSNASKVASVYTLKQLKRPAVSKYSSKKIKVAYTRISGAAGYEIASSTKRNKGYKVIRTTGAKTQAATIKVKRNTKYYYKVRAYNIFDGKKVYGPWSSSKLFTLK